VDRRARPYAAVLRRRAGRHRARQPEGGRPSRVLLRSGSQPELTRTGAALRHDHSADACAKAARQGEGGGRGAGGRALDSGTPPEAHLLSASAR
jgi:hypothetical protein